MIAKKSHLILALSLTAATLLAHEASAQGTAATPSSWPHKVVQKWKVNVGTSSKADNSLTLAEGHLFTIVREPDFVAATYCLNPENGEEIWNEKYHSGGSTENQPASGRFGPTAQPAVLGDRVLTVDDVGVLSCVNGNNGKLAWRKTGAEGYPKSFTTRAPVMSGDYGIYFPAGHSEIEVQCLDMISGRPKWSWNVGETCLTTPVIMTLGDTRLVIVQTKYRVVALNLADGKALWEASFNPNSLEYNSITPIVNGQTLIYAGQRRGATAVTLSKEGDKITGKEIWSNEDLCPQFSTMLLKDGLVYALTYRGQFVCVNATTGKTAWKDPKGSQLAFGSIVDAGSVLLAFTPKSELIVIQPGDKAYTELANVTISNLPIYSTPVVSGNRIYIQETSAISMWMIE